MIRSGDGGVISSGYGKLENVAEAFHAEIVAFLQALQSISSTRERKGGIGDRAGMKSRRRSPDEFFVTGKGITCLTR